MSRAREDESALGAVAAATEGMDNTNSQQAIGASVSILAEPTQAVEATPHRSGGLTTVELCEVPLAEGDARRLTQQISLLLDSAAGVLDKLAAAIREARDRRADIALGYASWAEYASTEFAPHTTGLSAAIRRNPPRPRRQPQH